MIDRLLEIMDRQCRVRPDGRTTIAALADALYRDTSPSGLHAVRQLLYRARRVGHEIESTGPANGTTRVRRVQSKMCSS